MTSRHVGRPSRQSGPPSHQSGPPSRQSGPPSRDTRPPSRDTGQAIVTEEDSPRVHGMGQRGSNPQPWPVDTIAREVSDLPPEPPEGVRRLREMRASDTEREQAVELLRQAAAEGRLTVEELEDRIRGAYAARTRIELDRLIADVSMESISGGQALTAPNADSRVVVREGPGGSRWVLSIMSGHDRRGRWRIAPKCTVLNVMGGSDIDMCEAELASLETQLNVYSVMGGGEIRVPHGVEVHVSQFAFMGGNDVELGDERPPPTGGPVLRVRLVSIMGGSSVRRGPKQTKAQRRKERELHRADQHRELH